MDRWEGREGRREGWTGGERGELVRGREKARKREVGQKGGGLK